MKTRSNVQKMDQTAIDAFLKKNRVRLLGMHDNTRQLQEKSAKIL